MTGSRSIKNKIVRSFFARFFLLCYELNQKGWYTRHRVEVGTFWLNDFAICPFSIHFLMQSNF
jgi:hypothetical protein